MTQLQLPENKPNKICVLLQEDLMMLAVMPFVAMEVGPSPASTADSHTVRILSYLGLSVLL